MNYEISLENYDSIKNELDLNYMARKSELAPEWMQPLELPASHVRTIEALELAAYLHYNLRANEPVKMLGLFGPPGSGKSTVAKEIAHILGLPYVNIALSGDTVLSEILGSHELVNGQTDFRLSNMANVLAFGGVVELAEINMPRADALGELHSILDGNNVIHLPNGQPLYRHPTCFVVATCNIGLEGTKTMNGALKDRMQPLVRLKFPEKEMLREIVLKNLEGLELDYLLADEPRGGDRLDSMIDCFFEMRSEGKKESYTPVEDSVTLRWLMSWCRYSLIKKSICESGKSLVATAANFDSELERVYRGVISQFFAAEEEY